KKENNIFNLVGCDGSLRSQIEQAKAAVIYPPKGLSTLIIGPTGVGKSIFAEYMYKYSLTIKEDIVIMHHYHTLLVLIYLYNHAIIIRLSALDIVKEAFTGADKISMILYGSIRSIIL
ncbi:hypothetical protein BM533_11195, partial [Clostridioides difficile]